MKILIFILVLLSIHSFAQDHSIDLESNLKGQTYMRALNMISDGVKEFYMLERICYGGLYLAKSDSCEENEFQNIIFVTDTESDTVEVIRFDNCGRQPALDVKSDAINFYMKNREHIQKEKFVYKGTIDHACHLTFYEIKNARVTGEIDFCQTQIELDQNKDYRKFNEGLRSYHFFSLIMNEIDELKNAR